MGYDENMKQIEQTYTIQAAVSAVWKALTDGPTAEEWGAGPAKVDTREGGEFSYWDGDIHGTFTKLVPKKLIEQDWYEHDRPERLHKVTFTFESATDATLLHLKQTDVGEDEYASMLSGWDDYYFDPIKKLLGQQ